MLKFALIIVRSQVPYKTTKAFPISEDYTVPANSMVIPSFYNSLHDSEVFPQPDEFQPERWLDPTSSANMNPKNYLVWGSGPHRCIGLEYAMMNMALVLATAAVMFDWEHEITPESYEIECVLFTSFSFLGKRALTIVTTASSLPYSPETGVDSNSPLAQMHDSFNTKLHIEDCT